MKSVLVITKVPVLLDQVRSLLKSGDVQTIHRTSVENSEPLIQHGLAHACLFFVEELDIQGFWAIEKMVAVNPELPIIVVTPDDAWTWEKEAYQQGVQHVLSRSRMDTLLEVVINRALLTSPGTPVSNIPQAPVSNLPASRKQTRSSTLNPEQASALAALKKICDFSSVLTQSLCVETLLEKFILSLRNVIGVNRAVVFLSDPSSTLKKNLLQSPTGNPGLQIAYSIGITSEILDNIGLRLETGIGRYLKQHSRILQKDSAIVDGDFEMKREFDFLGGQVAIPILDRESMIGLIVLDDRVTGEPLSNPELELIFHLFEDVGLAIKNIWLHDQLETNNTLMANVLQELNNACVVVGSSLNILHANRMASRYFKKVRRKEAFDFSDLPEELGSKVYQVFQTGTALEPYDFKPDADKETTYHVSISPFEFESPGRPSRVLIIAEDQTQSVQLKKLEMEADSLRLVKSMSERLAHEIGNAIVPLSTHEQLLKSKYEDEEFRESLAATMTDGVRRISRLAKQMFFLSREHFELSDNVPLSKLVDEAFKTAKELYSGQSAKMKFTESDNSISIPCDPTGLKYALTEVFLNALQANPKKSLIEVKASRYSNGSNTESLKLTVSDPGKGFTDESVRHATEPFFSTRTVGIGLGLTVADKIIDRHHGSIHLSSPGENSEEQVEIVLPLAEE